MLIVRGSKRSDTQIGSFTVTSLSPSKRLFFFVSSSGSSEGEAKPPTLPFSLLSLLLLSRARRTKSGRVDREKKNLSTSKFVAYY